MDDDHPVAVRARAGGAGVRPGAAARHRALPRLVELHLHRPDRAPLRGRPAGRRPRRALPDRDQELDRPADLERLQLDPDQPESDPDVRQPAAPRRHEGEEAQRPAPGRRRSAQGHADQGAVRAGGGLPVQAGPARRALRAPPARGLRARAGGRAPARPVAPDRLAAATATAGRTAAGRQGGLRSAAQPARSRGGGPQPQALPGRGVGAGIAALRSRPHLAGPSRPPPRVGAGAPPHPHLPGGAQTPSKPTGPASSGRPGAK